MHVCICVVYANFALSFSIKWIIFARTTEVSFVIAREVEGNRTLKKKISISGSRHPTANHVN